jgi:hypothetical protein
MRGGHAVGKGWGRCWGLAPRSSDAGSWHRLGADVRRWWCAVMRVTGEAER